MANTLLLAFIASVISAPCHAESGGDARLAKGHPASRGGDVSSSVKADDQVAVRVVYAGSTVEVSVKLSGKGTELVQSHTIPANDALDLSIDGNGYFKILRPDGTTGYTRNGAFALDCDGKVVTAQGMCLQPSLKFPPGATSISIAADGTVSYLPAGATSPVILNQLTLTTFPHPGDLRSLGQDQFMATGASGLPTDGLPGQVGFGVVQSYSLEQVPVSLLNIQATKAGAKRVLDMNSAAAAAARVLLIEIDGRKG